MTWSQDLWLFFIEAAWKSTLLLLAGLALAHQLSNRSAALRHLVWMSVLAGLLVLPAMRVAAPSLAIAPVIPVPASVHTGIQQVAARPITGEAPLAVAWAAGTLFVLLRLALAILRSRRIVASAAPLDRNWPEFAGNRVEIRHGEALSVPIATGIFRPCIILPSGACQWPIERLRVVVAHEMAHVLRRDCWINILIEIVSSVYWFHPLVWLAARKCREEAEKACDDQVLAEGADAADYAGHLLSTARAVRSIRLPGVAAAVVTSPSVLEKRLISILDRRRNRAPLNRRTMLAALTVAPVSVLVLCSLEPAIAQAPDSSRIHRIGEKGVTAPKVIYKVDPEYTQEARDARIAGTVTLSVEIDPDGFAQNIQVIRSLDAGLDQNAVNAVERWRFAPGKKDGTAVRVAARIEINFRLE